MKARLLIAILLMTQLGLTGLLIARWWDGMSTGEVEIIDQPDVQIPEVGGLTLERGAEVARRQAASWDPDARLVLVSAQYDWPLDESTDQPVSLPPGGWLTYVVMAPHDDGSNRALAMEIERHSGEIVVAEEIPWRTTDVPSLPLAAFPIASDDALRLAEEAAGAEFRAECPISRGQTVITLNVPTETMESAGGLQIASTPSPSRGTDLPAPPAITVEPTPAPDLPRVAPDEIGPAGASPVLVVTPVIGLPATIVPSNPAVGTPTAAALTPPSEATPFWLVTYQDSGAQDPLALSVRVNVVTGEIQSVVEDIDGNEPPCGEDV